MESKKINLNKIFNVLTVILAIIALSTIVGVCLFAPVAVVRATEISKSEILKDNINFVTAKTNSQVATAYSYDSTKKQYVYTYSTDTKNLYFGDVGATTYGDNQGATILEEENNPSLLLSQHAEVNAGSFIPTNTTHFKNVNGQFEEIFYSDTVENGFVLLNNYSDTQFATSQTKNIENFYISFGSPYSPNETHNYILINGVKGLLYTDENKDPYTLNLNTQQNAYIQGTQKQISYWHQYFDLSNITTGTSQNPVAITNQEGRYEIEFTFKRYDKNQNIIDETPLTYKYVFYLLDSANYAKTFPTIQNTIQNKIVASPSQPIERFSQKGVNDAYLEYDPLRYNIGYLRSNFDMQENISTKFSITKYKLGENDSHPMGIISFKDSVTNKVVKTVYILTYKVSVNEYRYLYLSNEGDNELSLVTSQDYSYTYEDIKDCIINGDISYEYARAEKVDVDNDTRTINTYIVNSIPQLTTPFTFTYGESDKVSDNTTTIVDANPSNRYQASLKDRDGELKVNYSYRLPLEELGEYSFNYSYNLYYTNGNEYYLVNDDTLIPEKITDSYSAPASANADGEETEGSEGAGEGTGQEDGDGASQEGGGENQGGQESTEPTTPVYDLFLTSWKTLDANNRAIINDVEYTYYRSGNEDHLYRSNGTTSVDIVISTYNATDSPNPTYHIEKTAKGSTILKIKYKVGTYTKTTTETKYHLGGDINKPYYTNIVTTTTYTKIASLPFNTQFAALQKVINTLWPSNATTTTITTLVTEDHKASQDSEKLHVFGSMPYFNKTDETTDKGLEKLEEYNKYLNYNYSADITSMFDSTITIENAQALFASQKIKMYTNSNKDDGSRKIINTNATPVSWGNFSTINPANSKIYHFPNYTFDSNGLITLGEKTASSPTTYTGDKYIGESGLYIIFVEYTYDRMPTSAGSTATTYTQVFTFVISNISPTLNISHDKSETTTPDFKTLDKKYTNKDVRISWDMPNIFQYDVYIKLEILDFSNKKLWSGDIFNKDVTTSSLPAHITTTVDKENSKYIVDIDSTTNASGKYFVTLCYGKNSNSSITKSFILDNEAISGMNIYGITENNETDNGKYRVDTSQALSQITNQPFTFRYNRKNSEAPIETYVYKVEILNNTSNKPTLINLDNGKKAVTNTYYVYGNDAKINLAQFYNYNYEISTNIDSNFFIPDNSCIYIFELSDVAGNTATFTVLFDKTTPAYLIELEPENNINRIIDGATKVTWGDYKAISIIKNSDEANNTRLNKALDEIKELSSSVEIQNDNLLIKISNKNVKNNDIAGLESSAVDVNEYYLFTKNPVNGNEITLPVFNGNVRNEQKYSFTSSLTQPKANFVKGTCSQAIDETTTTWAIEGMYGEGFYAFTIADALGNSSSTLLWMNMDKTQTIGYGTFSSNDTSFAKALPLYNQSPDTYALNALYMTSIKPNEVGNEGLDYTLSYNYYPINLDVYKEITKIEYVEGEKNKSDLKFTIGEEKDKNFIYYPITDEDGNEYPINSYPYDLKGNLTSDVYGSNPTSYGEKSIRSQLINGTLEGSKWVTRQGFYIFKREYTNLVTDAEIQTEKEKAENSGKTEEEIKAELIAELLGDDTRIKYLSYYVDRTGIIDTTSVTHAGKDIKFTLGAEINGTPDKDYMVEYDYSYIESKFKESIGHTQSNHVRETNKLYTTNKMLVNFKVSNDKFNYDTDFYNSMSASLLAIADANSKTYLEKTLLNKKYFSDGKYKLDLKLELGKNPNSSNTAIANRVIINELSSDSNLKIFENYTANFFANNGYKLDDKTRSNNFYMHLGDQSNNYYATIADQGTMYVYKNNQLLEVPTYANQVLMEFQIVHTPPEGEFYSKYYGGNVNINYDREGSSSLPLTTITDPSTEKNVQVYNLLKEYMHQLQNISDSTTETMQQLENGALITLSSINHETLIFAFKEETSEQKAKIDTQNIQIYVGGYNEKESEVITNSSRLIFNRVNGSFPANTAVSFYDSIYPDSKVEKTISGTTMDSAFITNVMDDGTIYHAIIVYDNNLDKIYSDTEKENYNGSNLKYRLLESDENLDNIKYYIKIRYLGDEDNYKGKTNNDTESYADINCYSSTYCVTIDRTKPNYNITKLMELDKYYNSKVSTQVDATNHNTIFEEYKPYYNITDESEKGTVDSYLSNYFFAVDSRENSSFIFEQSDKFDNNGALYFREISKSSLESYSRSLTPDDYESYTLKGHLQFSPTMVKEINTSSFQNAKLHIGVNDENIDSGYPQNQFYKIAFSLPVDNNGNTLADDKCPNKNLSLYKLINAGVFKKDRYYEIIESDEAGNYRVYGIYIQEPNQTKITFGYNATAIDAEGDTLTSVINTVNIGGTDLNFNAILSNDYYQKIVIDIKSERYNYVIYASYNPVQQLITIQYTGSENHTDTFKITSNSTFVNDFKELLNKVNSIIKDKSKEIKDAGYSRFGHSITITFVDRIGLEPYTDAPKEDFKNFTVNFLVAGDIIIPQTFDSSYKDKFGIKIPGIKETGENTYVTDLKVEKFNKEFIIETQDANSISFPSTVTQFKAGPSFYLSSGVWKLTITDNFNRTNVYYFEFLNGETHAGGSLTFQSGSIQEDGKYITGNIANYTYSHSRYSVKVIFYGKYYVYDEESEEYILEDCTENGKEITNINQSNLSIYGINVNQGDVNTTLQLSGINGQPYSRYEIITTLAKDEGNVDGAIVYKKDVTIYKAIQTPSLKNINGSLIDLSGDTTINLTEDVYIISDWDENEYPITEGFKTYDSKIVLSRTYFENGKKLTKTLTVTDNYKISEHGTYTAYIKNALGVTSKSITFVRSKDTITLYAVYTVDNILNEEKQLNESNYITLSSQNNAEMTPNISTYNYFVIDDFFGFYDPSTGVRYKVSDINGLINENIDIDTTASRYIDVRVSSNINVFSRLLFVETVSEWGYPIATFEIYSKGMNSDGEETIIAYRYINIHFLPNKTKGLQLVNTSVVAMNSNDTTNLAENVFNITRNDSGLKVTFSPYKIDNNQKVLLCPQGINVYIDRYYNQKLVETLVFNASHSGGDFEDIVFNITTVGMHTFKIRDMAGRYHNFKGPIDPTSKEKENTYSDTLKILLINQILYTINGDTPINNQIFNDLVILKVENKLDNQTLYKSNVSFTIYKDGIQITPQISDNTIVFTDHGYYSVEMIATTDLSSSTQIIIDKEITTTYSFIILKENIAMKSFGISNGNFFLDSIVKISEGYSTPLNYRNPDSLVYLTYEKTENTNIQDGDKIYGNAKYEITLRYYDENLRAYRPFTFKVWISGDKPNIISNIIAGSTTTDDIKLTYNPGLIYTQVGKCRLFINGEEYLVIDENSDIIPATITLSKKGDYTIELISEDGNTLISSYKFTKKDPFNSTTKLILICSGIGVVVLVAIFFLIRRKGKYR